VKKVWRNSVEHAKIRAFVRFSQTSELNFRAPRGKFIAVLKTNSLLASFRNYGLFQQRVLTKITWTGDFLLCLVIAESGKLWSIFTLIRMKKILIPTDFSNAARWALDVAAKIARKANAEIILLHVIEQPTTESFNAQGQVDIESHWEDKLFTLKMIERGKALLNAAAEPLQKQVLSLQQEIRIGHPFHGIQTVISERQVDLMVMGTTDHTKMEEWMIGSNTEKAVRYSKCPVLTVHNNVLVEGIKNIIYATSLSQAERDFASVVKGVQELFGSVIHVVRINTPMNFRPDTAVKKAMENFARQVHLQNYTLNIFNDFSEEEGILHFATSVQADLIAMATHGRTGFAHVLAGSIAEDVVNHSVRPVLTFVVR